MDCLFCKIVKGDIKSFKIYEDNLVYAFLDINPISNGHTLIIPKKHYDDFTFLDEKLILHINIVAKKIINLLKEKLGYTGFSLVTNYLDLQEIKHFHLHIITNNKENILNVKDIYAKIKNS